jgi:hypothetical protein
MAALEDPLAWFDANLRGGLWAMNSLGGYGIFVDHAPTPAGVEGR